MSDSEDSDVGEFEAPPPVEVTQTAKRGILDWACPGIGGYTGDYPKETDGFNSDSDDDDDSGSEDEQVQTTKKKMANLKVGGISLGIKTKSKKPNGVEEIKETAGRHGWSKGAGGEIPAGEPFPWGGKKGGAVDSDEDDDDKERGYPFKTSGLEEDMKETEGPPGGDGCFICRSEVA